jgi:hypothetical protein
LANATFLDKRITHNGSLEKAKSFVKGGQKAEVLGKKMAGKTREGSGLGSGQFANRVSSHAKF